jgi:hypothetical protein
MTPLRAKYIRDLTVRGRAQRTQRAYTGYVSELACHYQRLPELTVLGTRIRPRKGYSIRVIWHRCGEARRPLCHGGLFLSCKIACGSASKLDLHRVGIEPTTH